MNPIETLHEIITAANLWENTFTINRNKYIKPGGTTDTNLYYITEGSVRVFLIREQEEHTIRLGYSHNFIAALDSFITEKPSDFYIQAIKKTKVKVISKQNYMQLINSNRNYVEIWNTLLQQLIVQQMEREQDILIQSPKARYLRVLKRSPQLFQEVPHKYIAAYLRMTPETLSRIKKS